MCRKNEGIYNTYLVLGIGRRVGLSNSRLYFTCAKALYSRVCHCSDIESGHPAVYKKWPVSPEMGFRHGISAFLYDNASIHCGGWR